MPLGCGLMKRVVLCVLMGLLGSVSVVAAQGVDPATGASTRQIPPSPQVDFTHLALDIAMVPTARRFRATERLDFTTLALPLRSLDLDAVGMTIFSVTDADGNDVDYRYDDETLTVRFAEPLAPRSKHTLVFDYEVVDPTDGMTFALPDAAYPDRPLMVHTQGQPESNRYWVICHDYPNDRMTTEMKVAVPDGLSVLANGERLAEGENGVWHYRMQKPHVSYLMSLVVGDFDIVRADDWRGKRIEYWVPPGRAADAERTFGRTQHMLEFFSDKLGQYPWEAYSQSVVYLFGSGGMENTTVTTMYQDCIVNERAAVGSTLDGLVAHELAHQWFGDHTTCKTWAHLWLNEGFATFLDHAWHESYYGRDEYAYEVFTNMRRNAEADDVAAGNGLVWPYYEQPGDTFRRGVCNPYGKGSAVIHMLREAVGDDDAFWESLKLFQSRYGLSSVESDQLRQCFEEVTGRDFEQFWQQWVYRPGTPKLDIGYSYDADAGVVALTVRQTQDISNATPAFAHDLPVWCVMENGDVRQFTVTLDGKRNNATLATGEEPVMVIVDPNNSLISLVDFSPPLAMTLKQATDGPTPFARLAAIDRLGGVDDDRAVETLAMILNNNDRHWGQRSEAARSLGRMDTAAARQALVDATVDHPMARQNLVSALGEYKHVAAAEALVPYATQDESLYVEAAALSGLGNQKPTNPIVTLLMDETSDTGHGLRVRSAAVESLAKLGVPEALEPSLALADYGTSFRARRNGFVALATLYPTLEDDAKERVRDFLVSRFDDPMPRYRSAAVRALGDTLDTEAVEPLQRLADSAADDELKETARAAIQQIRSGDSEPAMLRELRDRVDELEAGIEAERAERREKAIEGQ